MEHWIGYYKDEKHDGNVEVVVSMEGDQFKTLQMTIDGIVLEGYEFCDWDVKQQDVELASQKFTLINNELQNYLFEVTIPLSIMTDDHLTLATIHLSLERVKGEYDLTASKILVNGVLVPQNKLVVHELYLQLHQDRYDVKKRLDFEYILEDFQKIILPHSQIHACAFCRWADYSPYGNGYFGTLQCYKACQEKFLKVKDKEDNIRLIDEEREHIIRVYETYLCPSFEHK